MTQPTFQMIPLSKLHISKKNMRHSRKKPDIVDLVPSIKQNGLLQNLLVREEDGCYGVVAGRRRWFSLMEIATEAQSPEMLAPCLILSEGDALKFAGCS